MAIHLKQAFSFLQLWMPQNTFTNVSFGISKDGCTVTNNTVTTTLCSIKVILLKDAGEECIGHL